MCTGGSAKKAAKKQRQMQEQQMAVQQQQFTEQMAAQRQTLATQQAQYEEQFEIANAAPPPAPNPVAEAAAMATDTDSAAMLRMGSGRRAMRSDLSIPAVASAPVEAREAVKGEMARYEGAPRRSKARANAELLLSRTPAAEAAMTPAEERQVLKVERKAAKRAAKQERKAAKRAGGLSIPGNLVGAYNRF